MAATKGRKKGRKKTSLPRWQLWTVAGAVVIAVVALLLAQENSVGNLLLSQANLGSQCQSGTIPSYEGALQDHVVMGNSQTQAEYRRVKEAAENGVGLGNSFSCPLPSNSPSGLHTTARHVCTKPATVVLHNGQVWKATTKCKDVCEYQVCTTTTPTSIVACNPLTQSITVAPGGTTVEFTATVAAGIDPRQVKWLTFSRQPQAQFGWTNINGATGRAVVGGQGAVGVRAYINGTAPSPGNPEGTRTAQSEICTVNITTPGFSPSPTPRLTPRPTPTRPPTATPRVSPTPTRTPTPMVTPTPAPTSVPTSTPVNTVRPFPSPLTTPPRYVPPVSSGTSSAGGGTQAINPATWWWWPWR